MTLIRIMGVLASGVYIGLYVLVSDCTMLIFIPNCYGLFLLMYV